MTKRRADRFRRTRDLEAAITFFADSSYADESHIDHIPLRRRGWHDGWLAGTRMSDARPVLALLGSGIAS
jgi:hypothetical protein